PYAPLAGISLPVTLEAPLASGKAFVTTGGFLFAPKGYSGPCVLHLSHLCVGAGAEGRQRTFARWTAWDAGEWEGRLRQGEGTLLGALRERLPARLAEALLGEAGVSGGTQLAQLQREDRRRVVEALTRLLLPWT